MKMMLEMLKTNYKMKYKKFFFPLFLLLMSFPVSAQDEAEGDDAKTFRFIYVAPDNAMSQQRLLADLMNHRNYAVSEGSPAIFYLASSHDPVIVKFNLPDDNSDDFDSQFLGYLKQSMSVNVEASYDRQRILELFRQYNFIDDEGRMNYKKVEINFHAGKQFWEFHNNESVIGALYFELNARKYVKEDKMQFHVFFRCPPSRGSLDREKPFGDINLDNINENVIPQSTD